MLPASWADEPASFLAGTGSTTNPVFVRKLALWWPPAAVVAAGLLRARPWGCTLAGSILTMWVMESVTVAVDQWFGAQADPASTIVSTTMVPLLGVLAAVGLVPVYMFVRQVGR